MPLKTIDKTEKSFFNLHNVTTKKILSNPAVKESMSVAKILLPKKRIPTAAPKPEAEAVPKTSGLASGFCKIPCIAVPANARAEPTITESITRGRRISNKICCFTSPFSTVCRITSFTISDGIIENRPIKQEAIAVIANSVIPEISIFRYAA